MTRGISKQEPGAGGQLVGGFAVLLVIGTVGCRPNLGAGHAVAGTAPLAAATPAGEAVEVVMTGPPVRKSLKLVTVQPARVEPIEQTPIQSKLAAYVAEVAVDYGDRVKKDQPLLKLSAPELDAELAQKKALLEQARAELAQAESGVKAAQAAIETAKSRVKESQANIDRSRAEVRLRESELARVQQLAASGSLNQQLVDEAQQKLAASEASVTESLAATQSSKAMATQAEAEAARATADVEAARARVGVAAANIDHVHAMRSYLTIKAPFDGVVTLRRVDPGHFVQPASAGSSPLLTVARTDKMRVIAPVPEIEAAFVDIGDEATLEVQSLRGADFTGKVTRTNLALDEDSRALDAIIDLDNADGRLRPGMFATARLMLQEEKDVLTLPGAAVVRQGKEAFCYRLADGKAKRTTIQLGIRVGDDVEITSGLSGDDTVILNKATSLKDGQAVEAAVPQAK